MTDDDFKQALAVVALYGASHGFSVIQPPEPDGMFAITDVDPTSGKWPKGSMLCFSQKDYDSQDGVIKDLVSFVDEVVSARF